MASFADKIPQFNPYIQQLPVEAMVEVGMQKQKQYEEGVQKIQTQIDNVAGLDVIRDVDKQYLQSKLNALGSKLKTVAAGDFSNFQLVNSVGGMTNQIAKDSDIINAVASTQAYRAGIKDMNDFTKEGKGSPSNDWDFKTEANRWLSGDLKHSFNGKYNPYTNYKKNALEALKSVTKDETITDASFAQVTDSKGKVSWVPTDATTRTKLAGVPPEKIQEALMATLTPADFKQMEIDGRYQYSNMDSKTFIDNVNSSYNGHRDALEDQKAILENAKTTTTSAQEKAKLDEQIGSIDKSLSRITGEYENISKTFAAGDVESAKARLSTSNFMNSFSKAFGYTQTSQTQETNPSAVMAMTRSRNNQDFQLAKAKLEQDDRHFGITSELARQKLEIDRAAEDRAAGKTKGTKGSGLYGGTSFTVNQDDVPIVAAQKVALTIEQTTKDLAASDQTFMKQRGKDQAWLDQQKAAYVKNPSGVDPVIRDYFQKTDEARRNNESLLNVFNQVTSEVEAKHGGSIYAHIPKNSPSLVYKTSSGNVTFSPKDIVDFNNVVEKYTSSEKETGAFPGSSVNRGIVFADEQAKKELTDKQKLLYDIQKKAYASPGSLTENEKALVKGCDVYKKLVNGPYRSILKNVNDEVGEILKTKLSATQGVEYGINLSDEDARSQWKNTLARFASVAESMEGGLANSPKFDINNLREIITKPETSNIKVVEGTQFQPSMYEITVSGGSGKKPVETTFRLSAQQYHETFGSMYEANPAAKVARPYLEQIMRTPGEYSTAYDGKATNLSNSFLNNSDFQSVKLFGLSGNIENHGGSYSIRLNLHDPITGKWHEDIPYPQSGLIVENAIAPALRDLNDYQVFKLIYKRYPTANDIDKIQQATQNPSYGR